MLFGGSYMKLRDYMENLQEGEEVTCWDNVIDSEFYFYKKTKSNDFVLPYSDVEKLDNYFIDNLEIEEILDDGIEVGLSDLLDNPHIIKFAKENLYTNHAFESDEDVLELLFNDVVKNFSMGFEKFSKNMVECFENLEKIVSKTEVKQDEIEFIAELDALLNKYGFSYEDLNQIYKRKKCINGLEINENEPQKNKYYEISIYLGSIEAGSYSIYVEGVSDEKEALLKAEEKGIYYGENGSIEFVAELDEKDFKNGIEKNEMLTTIADIKKNNPDMRIMKIYAGMDGLYEMIASDAPDYIIEQQLLVDMTMESEGFTIDDPYSFIKKAGYSCKYLYSQDDALNWELDYDYDTSFDWYDFEPFEVSGKERLLREIISEVLNIGVENKDVDMMYQIAEKKIKEFNAKDVSLSSLDKRMADAKNATASQCKKIEQEKER